MKVLVLIISSDNDPVYAQHREIWLQYMNLNPQFECYFYQYHDGPQKIENNTFWLNGVESYDKIIVKTIDAFDFFMKRDNYDFIVRTNLSSVWNFPLLIDYLNTLPKEKVYSGVIGQCGTIPFCSGSGFIMTPDIVKLLIEKRDIAESVKIMDDVDIGYTMLKLNIPFTLNSRNDSCIFQPTIYHYRCKRGDRTEEKELMKSLIRNIYNV
jgi:hypothetical protein